MRFWKKLFTRGKPSTEHGDLSTESRGLISRNVKVVRWTDDPDGVSTEECARKGIESVAGLLITGDAFGTANVPDQDFLTCVEFYYSTGDGNSDFIGAYFRQVKILEGSPYPSLGQEHIKMVIQPLSDGSFTATWNTIDRSRRDESLHGVGMMVIDETTMSAVWSYLPIGHIPPQEWDDHSIASFLIKKTIENGWEIWRRFSPVSIMGEYVRQEDGSLEETYVQIYPNYDPNSSHSFRIKEEDGNTRIFW